MYRVTVEVSDGKLKATRPMTVTVTDVEEDGEVKLSTVAPKVGIVALTASLKDSDGGVETGCHMAVVEENIELVRPIRSPLSLIPRTAGDTGQAWDED